LRRKQRPGGRGEKIKQDLTAGFDVMFGKDKLKFVGHKKRCRARWRQLQGDAQRHQDHAERADAPKAARHLQCRPKDEDKYSISNLLLPIASTSLCPTAREERGWRSAQQFSGVWSKSFSGFLVPDL
jgi:hypothetical protein